MTAKMQAAWMAAQQGCSTIIANGKASDNLLQVGGQLWPCRRMHAGHTVPVASKLARSWPAITKVAFAFQIAAYEVCNFVQHRHHSHLSCFQVFIWRLRCHSACTASADCVRATGGDTV